MQHGEDKWLERYFRSQPGGCAVEVGASDGLRLSNTLALERSGWSVLCIEPNPLYEPFLKQNRALSIIAACGKENRDDVPFHVFESIWKNEDTGDVVNHYLSVSSLEPSQRLADSDPSGINVDCPFIVPRVYVRTLDWCLDAVGFERCDVASIDTEGTEADVLAGFDTDRWKTRIVLVENNFDEEETRTIMRGRGFTLLDRLGVNDIWEKR
jgi:FkbM family methyltransferase